MLDDQQRITKACIQPKPAVNQQQAVASIAKSLKNVPLTPRNLLSALVSRGLELTNR